MRIKNLCYLIIFFNLALYSQDKDFMNGTESLKNGNYNLADSLLSISINNYSHPAKLYNRALTRIYLKDSIGFCSDLKDAYTGFHDKEAMSLYLKTCVDNIDSILYDKRFLPSEDKVRYLELTFHDKYINNTWGEFLDLRKTHEVSRLGLKSGLQSYKTNVIANYEIIDNIKVYSKVHTPAMCNLNHVNQILESSIIYSDELNKSLNKAKKPRITVYVGAIVNSEGLIKNPQLIKSNQLVDQVIIDEAIRVVALDGFEYKSAIFNKKNVASRAVIPVNFRNK